MSEENKSKLPWPTIRLSGHEIIGEARAKEDYGVVLADWFCPLTESQARALYDGAKSIIYLAGIGHVVISQAVALEDWEPLNKAIDLLKKGIGSD